MHTEWKIKPFEGLTTLELYQVLQLRAKVFVVEQNCSYQDIDDKDLSSLHLMGFQNETLVAYARLLPAGISYATASIGRVVTDPTVRGTGIGRELMHEALRRVEVFFDTTDLTISAQDYLREFYASFGFVPQGEVYLEDDIPHVEMHRKGDAAN